MGSLRRGPRRPRDGVRRLRRQLNDAVPLRTAADSPPDESAPRAGAAVSVTTIRCRGGRCRTCRTGSRHRSRPRPAARPARETTSRYVGTGDAAARTAPSTSSTVPAEVERPVDNAAASGARTEVPSASRTAATTTAARLPPAAEPRSPIPARRCPPRCPDSSTGAAVRRRRPPPRAPRRDSDSPTGSGSDRASRRSSPPSPRRRGRRPRRSPAPPGRSSGLHASPQLRLITRAQCRLPSSRRRSAPGRRAGVVVIRTGDPAAAGGRSDDRDAGRARPCRACRRSRPRRSSRVEPGTAQSRRSRRPRPAGPGVLRPPG